MPSSRMPRATPWPAVLAAVLLIQQAHGLAGSAEQDGLSSKALLIQQAHGLLGSAEQGDLSSKALKFLKNYAPPRDADLSPELLQTTVDYALKPRAMFAWSRAVPECLWLNAVLPYASVDEPRTNWRPLFWNVLAPLVKDCKSITEATELLNQRLWGLFHVHFQSSCTPEIMSPAQTWAAGHASCTGMSMFLISALRAVGIPARMAGTPEWTAPGGGNHDWVEVWDGAWSFTGPAEWSPQGLNHTWFFPSPAQGQVPGSGKHAIYATSWHPTGSHFPLSWNYSDHSVPGLDVTERYLKPQEARQSSTAC